MSEQCQTIIRCPGRPTWFLRRFHRRPWICPDCATAWTTSRWTTVADGGTHWVWREIGRYVKEKNDE